jgi:hypothetical protein
MLATGTLYGSPLSALGSETLGGQAFIHAFILLIAPIQYINGADTIFGLMLLMCLSAAAGWQRFHVIPGALIAPLLIVSINPQLTSLSYSSS